MFKNKKAIVFIHGYMENCEKSYSPFLKAEKFNGYDIILHNVVGHDGISEFKFEDEFKNLDILFDELFVKYKTISLVGFSMGGVLASYVASKYQIKRLVLIAPAFLYLQHSKFFPTLKSIFKTSLKEVILEKDLSAFKKQLQHEISNSYEDDQNIFKEINIDGVEDMPSIINFVKLVNYAKNQITKIDCPTLILHGELDELVPLESSQYIYEKITNENKILIVVGNSYHRVLKCDDATKYYKMIKDFIKYEEIKWR